jgi:hypothetical protein
MTPMRRALRSPWVTPWLFLVVVLLPLALSQSAAGTPAITRVDSIGITVSDMDRALAFYTGVLPFEVISEAEVAGDAYEHLFGVFGMRARIGAFASATRRSS